MDGILVVNKPSGYTSHDVVNIVRKYTKEKKCGHTGTLDPLASGVLVCCLGKATRLIQYISDGTKEYIAKMMFGISTDTLDSEGLETGRNENFLITKEAFLQTISKFVGEIDQVPPMYSAVHHNGQRLYDLARKGIVVDREARKVTVEKISCLSCDNAFPIGFKSEVEISVLCSKGTYIRSLIDDISKDLNAYAHMTSLVRTANSGFNISDAIDVEELKSDYNQSLLNLIPIEQGVAGLPKIELTDAEVLKVSHGNALKLISSGEKELVALFDKNNRLIAIAKTSTCPKNEVICQPKLVFCEV